MRGADGLVQALSALGVSRLFTLSGNQIMPVFDACIGTDIKLLHVRHEAAAVHMADAWGRLTGEPGIAMVTAGPGFANTLSALYVAKMAESPVVLLSGHAPLGQLGRGVFQEMAQAEMASHVAKASWMPTDAARLGHDLARAYHLARSGRPGPVHLSLPVDLLDAEIGQSESSLPPSDASASSLSDADLAAVVDAISAAQRPLILAGPAVARAMALAADTGLPVVGMESPRGVNDPSLGAFAEALAQADLIVLLGKQLDFMVQQGRAPAVSPDCRFIHIDAEAEALEQTQRLLEAPRLSATLSGDPGLALSQLADRAHDIPLASADWYDDLQAAISYRPPAWAEMQSGPGEPLHAVEVCRAVEAYLSRDPDAIYISDGGEFGQWAQACLSRRRRVINGPSGAIGSAIPFAIAAREAFPDARIVAMLGDGTFGFHPSELDTASRYQLPFIAVVGNDAAWNAEYQIQLRDYGPDRLIGCELQPTHYNEVAQAFGGYGEHVSSASELPQALQRAHDSGLPACLNVSLAKHAAPVIRR